VAICPNCGQDNPEGFKFCPNCATPLAPAAAREQRKTVTVLFCDVTGSTALGESTDPEALRALLARYFERMKAILEPHGASVEKFIGDAVMAVFGVPVTHEDDALRACRAAVEMRDALPELGVQARIGLNTGEVVTGTEERLATGDAVNVAARLEQAAQPGEILIGEPTLELVREAVEVERVEPLAVKGKAEPVPAHRLLAVHEAAERRHETPFVGRAVELESLQTAWQRILGERRCELVTVVGEAGVGKSRLTAEFLASVAARVVAGRCLSYGEGITYWPVVEVVKQLDALPSDPAAAASIRALLGETEEGTSADEIAWAFRKLLEEQAPLVCVFDDIQWGEETFLDLVEGIALLSTQAPVLLLCMARPHLAERRPRWTVALRLDPLEADEVDSLLPETMPAGEREKIVHAAGGNPLFVTEMLAIARQTEGEVIVPPSLHALLASRLDQLEPAERTVLECGAVEGEIFHRGAVQALSDGEISPRLTALVRKELIRPDAPRVPAEDAFRFRHLLIRDAAYDALPKAKRAELHERFADWLEGRASDPAELDEILGYHLEQAARYKQELGQPDSQLAERAGIRLAAAGRRARSRDLRAAATLIERALELTRPIRTDVHLELDFARTQDPESAAEIAEAVAERLREAGDKDGETLALLAVAEHRTSFSVEPDVDDLERRARSALPRFEELEDHRALERIWFALGLVANFRCRFEELATAFQQSLSHARTARQMPAVVSGVGVALVRGPRPADVALRSLDAAMPESPHPSLLLARAWLIAMLARSKEATAIAAEASRRRREMTGDSGGEGTLAEIAALAGDHEAAARLLRRNCDILEEHGRRAELSSSAPRLGRELCALGRYEDAEPLAALGRDLGAEQDLLAQALWREVQARVDANSGSHNAAEALAREAVAIAQRTDSLNMQADAFCELAEVLSAAGRIDKAAATLERALERYERKKNLAMVAQVQPRLEALRAGVT
jgi:class 3 adenylate cyclase/tetratricopeptide (TPR) repeat protein